MCRRIGRKVTIKAIIGISYTTPIFPLTIYSTNSLDNTVFVN